MIERVREVVGQRDREPERLERAPKQKEAIRGPERRGLARSLRGPLLWEPATARTEPGLERADRRGRGERRGPSE